MYWADKVAKEIVDSGKYKPYWVDDMKTPSGFAHVGSLRGPLIHSVIFRALKSVGVKAKYTFVFNDFDHADELPPEFKERLIDYMGCPLREIPSPNPKFENLGMLLVDDLKNTLIELGVEAEFLSSYDLYHQGKFDTVIREALENSERIQDIYEKVSGSKKRKLGWYPFAMICEKCGKIGTTRAFAWDGKEVSYKCEPEMVSWARGCGYEGKKSPFGGNGKLPWKVDWPAHWKVVGVTIEGAGKDHASAGGSYDIAMELCDQVFKYHKPFKLPYEFLLIGGKKMSSSKGLGLKAHDITKILPPELVRFVFTRTDYRQQVDFDLSGSMAIPDLFDEYDKCWEAYVTNSNENLARAFELSQINKTPVKEKIFLPRFRDIANYQQQPNVDLIQKFEEEKGSGLKEKEEEILEERIKYAKIWLEKYAPEDFKVGITSEIPQSAKSLTDQQKDYLIKVANLVEKLDRPEDLQTAVYNLAKDSGINIKDAFSAIYLAISGKTSGPKAGWLLLQYPKEKIIERLRDTAKLKSEDITFASTVKLFQVPEYFSIDSKVKEKFPSVSVGIALIKGISIEKENAELQKEIDEFLKSYSGLTTEELGQFPEIVSYRKLYKEMGVDWHSRRPGPEELLRRIALKKGLYSINTCVDAYNLAVMKNHISVGAFDADKFIFPAILQFANEGDKVLLIGNTEPTKCTAKELVYYDQKGGYNLDFNYRDSQRTMITDNTKNAWINVDGIFDVTPEKVEQTLNEAVGKIVNYCGGIVEFKGVVV